MKRLFLRGVAFAVVVGLVFGGAMLSIAFRENPQGEFFDTVTGAINWYPVLGVFLSAMTAATLVTLVAEAALWAVLRMVRHLGT